MEVWQRFLPTTAAKQIRGSAPSIPFHASQELTRVSFFLITGTNQLMGEKGLFSLQSQGEASPWLGKHGASRQLSHIWMEVSLPVQHAVPTDMASSKLHLPHCHPLKSSIQSTGGYGDISFKPHVESIPFSCKKMQRLVYIRS